MKKVSLLIITLLLSLPLYASEPAQVMLIGTFHFSNPGKDVAQVKTFDVLDDASQSYLEEFAGRLAALKPTRVLLEYDPENEELMNQRYTQYLAGEYDLGDNEIYQLGFRIARQAGLESIKSFDHREQHWNAEPMFEYAKQHDSAEMTVFNEIISNFEAAEDKARTSMDLKGLLQRCNSPEQERMNMDLYLATNSIGVGDGWSGADASASWWQRNFRMYANIQQAAKPGERIIAIGGTGHMAILKTLLATDRRLQGVPVDSYF